MQTPSRTSVRRASPTASDLAISIMALLAVGVAAATGGPAFVASVLLALLLTSLGGTAVLWGLLGGRGRVDAVTVLGVGTATGAALLGFLAVPLRGLGPTVPYSVVAAAAAAAVGASLRAGRPRRTSLPPAGPVVALAFVGGIAVGAVPLALHHATFPVTATVLRPYLDLVWLQALTEGLLTRGLGDVPGAVGAAAQYHWLSYAWAGSLERLTGAPDLVVLARVAPAVTLVTTAALAIDLVRRHPIAQPIAPLAACLLLFGGAWVGGSVGGGGMSGAASLSTTMGAAWLMALTLVVLKILRGDCGAGAWPIVVLLAAAVCLGKVQMAVVAAGGLAAAAAYGRLRSEEWAGTAGRLVMGAAAGMLAVFFPLMARSEARSRLGFRPLRVAELLQFAPVDAALGALLLGGVAVLAYAASRLSGLFVSSDRTDPSASFAAGAALTGVGFALLLGDGIAAELVPLTGAAAVVVPLRTPHLLRAVSDLRPEFAGRGPFVRTLALGSMLLATVGALALRRESSPTLVALAPLAGLLGAVVAATSALPRRRLDGLAVAFAVMSLTTGLIHTAYMAGLAATGGSSGVSTRIEISPAVLEAGQHIRASSTVDDVIVDLGGCSIGDPTATDCFGFGATPLMVSGLPGIASDLASSFLDEQELRDRIRLSEALVAGVPTERPAWLAGRTVWLWLEPDDVDRVAASSGGEVSFRNAEVGIVRLPPVGP